MESFSKGQLTRKLFAVARLIFWLFLWVLIFSVFVYFMWANQYQLEYLADRTDTWKWPLFFFRVILFTLLWIKWDAVIGYLYKANETVRNDVRAAKIKIFAIIALVEIVFVFNLPALLIPVSP